MVRVKRGKTAHKRRKRVLKQTKGFLLGRKSKYRLAKDALFHAWTHAYRDRKKKKRSFRGLWQIQINAACREKGISYSKFINGLKKNKIEIDRKVLSELARKHPEIFEKIVEKIKK
ncbi:MAG: 50S ribosomal protein L20 [Candidatus Nealsonbacteria bacterium]